MNNPFGKGVAAFLATAAGIAATTAFAPVGVVGATGWAVAYLTGGSTFCWEAYKEYEKRSGEKK